MSAVPSVRRSGLGWWMVLVTGAVGAAVVNLIVLAVATLAGASLVVVDGGAEHPITVGGVIGASVVPLVVGTGAALLMALWKPVFLRIGQYVGGGLASWRQLLEAVRLGPEGDVAEVTAVQVRRVVEDLVRGGRWEAGGRSTAAALKTVDETWSGQVKLLLGRLTGEANALSGSGLLFQRQDLAVRDGYQQLLGGQGRS
ncbi:DUF6069 family protein [Streptomyces sp. NBC_00162]|nr:DUF6069 family protein [Streptomyces sp. NBC_00162]